jgi:hypothetical protein
MKITDAEVIKIAPFKNATTDPVVIFIIAIASPKLAKNILSFFPLIQSFPYRQPSAH